MSQRERIASRLAVGTVLVIVGLLLLFDQLGVLRFSVGSIIVGIFLVVLGLYRLYVGHREGRDNRIFLPGLFVLFGALFLVTTVFWPYAIQYFAALLIVFLGLGILVRSWREERSRRKSEKQ